MTILSRPAVLALALVTACGTEPRRVPGDLTVTLATAVFDDTIEVAPGHPAIATVVASDGLPVPDTLVQFTLDAARLGAAPGAYGIHTIRVKTDAQGQARAWVRFDSTAGQWKLRARIVGTSWEDSLPVLIRPGRAVSLSLAPRDSTLYSGARSFLRVTRRDRRGNAATALPVFTARRDGVLQVEDSTVLRGLATGRTVLVAELGVLRDSVIVSVVPEGQLVALPELAAGHVPLSGFWYTNVDGSGYRGVNLSAIGPNAGAPRWAPSGGHVVFHGFVGSGAHIFVETPAGIRTQITPALPGHQEFNPQYSRDGQWLYYSAVAPGISGVTLWRARADGSESAQVHPGASFHQPTPSPDGTRLAFLYVNPGDGQLLLRILDLATGTITPLDVPGLYPRWAPSGEEIAFMHASRLKVVSAATGAVTVLDSLNTYDSRYALVDWSPDAKWLVACIFIGNTSEVRLALVERSTGEVIPLAWSAQHRLCYASWKSAAP